MRLAFFQALLRGKVKDAARYYKTATKLDESSVLALSGIIACQLQEKQFEVAKEQLDFLQEFQTTASNRSEILYMSAVLARHTGKSAEEALNLLNEAVESHFRSVRGLAFGHEYLMAMNPDYVTMLGGRLFSGVGNFSMIQQADTKFYSVIADKHYSFFRATPRCLRR